MEESARGTGTGTLLLKTVAAIAHAEGCKRKFYGAFVLNGRVVAACDGVAMRTSPSTRQSCP